MDLQHRPGGKTGTGGVASASETSLDRRERMRQLALETINLNKVNNSLLSFFNRITVSLNYIFSLCFILYFKNIFMMGHHDCRLNIFILLSWKIL